MKGSRGRAVVATGATGLGARWRAEASLLRRRGADAQAVVLETCAAEFDEWLRERSLEALSLAEAERESGYSYSALQKMVARGELENIGDKHRPRVRRGDLPRKPLKYQRSQVGPALAEGILTQRA
jgi:hypothetical protein